MFKVIRFIQFRQAPRLFSEVCRPLFSLSKLPMSPERLRMGSPRCMSPSGAPSAAMLHTVKSKLESLLGKAESNGINIEVKAKNLVHYYQTLIPADKHAFLRLLATDYNVDQAAIIQLSQNVINIQERGTGVLLKVEDRLRHALVPRYQQLFTQISRLDQGVKFLVDLRADLLNILTTRGVDHDNSHLLAMNSNLRDVLSLWFSVGFLQLERITWESPCDMLQKISEYEAVHPIRNWTDLKRRVGLYRRCFVFTHSSMPREPVVVLHTALTSEISSSIQSIVSSHTVSTNGNNGNAAPESNEEDLEDPSLINTAIFYSITSTQKGLTGVELGNYLIKNAVKDLKAEFPSMEQYSSLSPIPGFKDWLICEINKYMNHRDSGEFPEQTLFTSEELQAIKGVLPSGDKSVFESLRKALQNNGWINTEATVQVLHQPLMRLCARYLFVEKRRNYALNPVANFHLRNGAVLWRLNWLADVSPRGLSASCGMMVNYRYFLEETEDNSHKYVQDFQIIASEQIKGLVKATNALGKVDR